MTLAQLVATCPANIQDAAGITSAIEWLAVCGTFAEASEVKDVPNKSMIKSYAYAYWEDVQLLSTDYAGANNKVQHIKHLINADIAVNS